ncbi:MAG: 1-acyl-sn-glycerol-3-phosphate acyltransferase [Clostridiales bacterium]|nr:1-acyl-sn-glycerol-3-phosphate acyltransferase [Clostridiales bacterium]
MLYRLLYILCWLPLKLMLPIKKVGKENLIKGKAILCCNHQTNWDFIPIFYLGKAKTYVLGKKELFKNKFWSWFFKSMRTIPIDRKKPEISSIKKCINVLNDNNNLLVFPEGTRTSSEDIEGLKNGVAMFCLKTKAPIIPMVYLKRNKIFRRNTLVIGKALEFDLEYNKENMKIVIEKLELEMKKLKEMETK